MEKDIISNESSNFCEEYVFPGLKSNREYNAAIIKSKVLLKPYQIRLYIFLVLYFIFMILIVALLLSESAKESGSSYFNDAGEYVHAYKADYTGTIICAVLEGITIILGIINILRSKKYPNIKYFQAFIKINNQYNEFIQQGYLPKEAYKLILEWIDRQDSIAAMSRMASSNALIAMSHINDNMNK